MSASHHPNQSPREYHRHANGDVVPGEAARCIDPNSGAEDVLVLPAGRESEDIVHKHGYCSSLTWCASCEEAMVEAAKVIEDHLWNEDTGCDCMRIGTSFDAYPRHVAGVLAAAGLLR